MKNKGDNMPGRWQGEGYRSEDTIPLIISIIIFSTGMFLFLKYAVHFI